MKRSLKPIRPCYSCMLNLGKYCWIYPNPRQQWKNQRCPGFENQVLYQAFQEWKATPDIKTRKQLRQTNALRRRRAALWRRKTKVSKTHAL